MANSQFNGILGRKSVCSIPVNLLGLAMIINETSQGKEPYSAVESEGVSNQIIHPIEDSQYQALLLKCEHLSQELQLAQKKIDELEKKNEFLYASDRRLALHLHQTPLAAMAWDEQDILTEWNDAAVKIFGFTKEEALGRNIFDLIIPEKCHGNVKEIFANVLASQAEDHHNINENFTKDGRRILCAWVNTALHDASGKLIGAAAMAQDITQKREAEIQLALMEERRQMLWENIPDYIAEIDLNGKIILCNHAWPVKQINEDGPTIYDAFLSERRAVLAQLISKSISTGLTQRYELPIIIDGAETWWSQKIIPLKNVGVVCSLLVVSSDITERKLAYQEIEQRVQERTEVLLNINNELKEEICTRKHIEIALRESEGRYYRLTTVTPVGIFRFNLKGDTFYVNEHCVRIIGLPVNEMMGRGWEKNVHPDDYARIIDEFTAAVQNQLPVKTKYRFLHEDGKIVWVVGEFITEVDENNNVTGYVGTITDITRLHQAEEKLHQRQIELAHCSRLSTVGEMISGIAHEVNQPLAMIVNYTAGCLQRMKKEDCCPDIGRVLQRIFEQAERAGEIIHRLKEFLRKGEVRKERLNINEVMRDSLSLLHGELHESKTKLHLDFQEKLPEIFMDKIQIEQVVINIIHNAIEAMRETPLARRQLFIKTRLCSVGEEILQISIQDTGSGISDEIATKIFDPFFTTKSHGMGVGLSISSTMVELYGGRITLDKDVKDGAKFVINLPINRLG